MRRLAVSDLTFEIGGLSRPECVIATARSGLFVSHDPVGIQHIAPDGRRTLYGLPDRASADFTPNGIALTSDGRLLIANTGLDGGVYQVTRDGACTAFLTEVDGRPLYPANFVLADASDRIWISVSTGLKPRSRAYSRDVSDGFIVLCDRAGARIVADGLGYANECRISNDGSRLYVNETFGRRISRYDIRADGSLGPRETFATLGAGDFPDGGVFDAEGGYWVTSVISNRIWRFDPDGRGHLFFEDANMAYVEEMEAAYQAGCLSAEMLYSDAGTTINHIASVTFGGPDLKTVYLGTLKMDCLPSFRSPVAGARPAHWNWTFQKQ